MDYTYIVARLRAIEAGMPDRGWYLRLARTPRAQLLAAVRERFAGFEQVGELHEFEAGIEAEREDLVRLLRALIGDPRVLTFLLAGCDFDNFTLAWKARITGGVPVLYPFGLVEPEAIAAAAGGGDPSALPDYLKDLHALFLTLPEADAAAVDYAGEGEKWSFLLRGAPGDAARDWARLRIDMANIGNFARLRIYSLRGRADPAVWIAGGSIEAPRLAALFGAPLEEFFAFLATTRWRALAGHGFEKGMPPGRIESALNRQLLELLSDAGLRFFDLVAVLQHMELRGRDWTLLRMVLAGRINLLPEELIAARVGELAN